MKASELIKELQKLIKQHGDRPITTCEVGPFYDRAQYTVRSWDYDNAFLIAGRTDIPQDPPKQ